MPGAGPEVKTVTVATATLPGLLFMRHLSSEDRPETGLWGWASLRQGWGWCTCSAEGQPTAHLAELQVPSAAELSQGGPSTGG